MGSDGRPAIWWVRRDFRLADNPALRSAIDDGDAVLPLFVLDPVLLTSAGQARREWLLAALYVLDRELRNAGGHGLSVLRGDPVSVVPRLAKNHEVQSVFVTADFGPYGRSRDQQVTHALAGHSIGLSRIGSPYAVAPGTLKNSSGKPFELFSPFHRAWLEHGVHEPAPAIRASAVQWLRDDDRLQLDHPDKELLGLPGRNPPGRPGRHG
jgi:deoxyribodipyrimidine photo-lyase